MDLSPKDRSTVIIRRRCSPRASYAVGATYFVDGGDAPHN